MKEVTDFLKECPSLSRLNMREDFLAPESGSAAVVADGGPQLLRQYTSGDLLGQHNFRLLIRENFTGAAAEIFGGLCIWIEEGNLPELSGGKVAQYVEITEGPSLIKTEVGAGIYEIKFRVVYYRKGAEI